MPFDYKVLLKIDFYLEETFFLFFFVLDLTFVNTAGVHIRVQGLGPLNWVWNMLVIGSIKKSIRMLLTLKLKEQLELSYKKESVIDRLYIPILERKFSRKY